MTCTARRALRALSAAFILALLLPACALAETFTCTVAEGQYVNVRKQPSTRAASWGVLHAGDTIEADPGDIRSGFYKTTFMGREAYVSIHYFEIADGRDYTVSANGRVRIRQSPGGKAQGFISPGAAVRVRAWRYAEDGSLWARCPGPKYIAAEYLQPAQ